MLSPEGTVHGVRCPDGVLHRMLFREGTLHELLSPAGTRHGVRSTEGALHGQRSAEGAQRRTSSTDWTLHGVLCLDRTVHGVVLPGGDRCTECSFVEGAQHGRLSTGADYTGRFHLLLSIPRLAAGELCRLGIAAASRVCHSR